MDDSALKTMLKFFRESIKTMDEESLLRERNRIATAIKGWDQYPFGRVHVEYGLRMLRIVDDQLAMVGHLSAAPRVV